MIDFSNLSLVLFDFDDTLCIHPRIIDYEYKTYCKAMLKSCDWWTDIGCKPSTHMKDFIEALQQNKVQLGLISATRTYIQMTRKIEWVKKNYNTDLENYCVAKGTHKVEMMEILSEAYNIPRNKILIVDDKEEILSEAVKDGFQAASPMEVVNFIDNGNED